MSGKIKILVMGLPGSGKTTFTKKLVATCSFHIDAFNGDALREYFSDWDFSDKGRLRQAQRMCMMADMSITNLGYHCVCDFVCPTEETRQSFNADITVWMDTIKESRFEDTNKIFEQPSRYDYRITEYDQYDDVIKELICRIDK